MNDFQRRFLVVPESPHVSPRFSGVDGRTSYLHEYLFLCSLTASVSPEDPVDVHSQ